MPGPPPLPPEAIAQANLARERAEAMALLKKAEDSAAELAAIRQRRSAAELSDQQKRTAAVVSIQRLARGRQGRRALRQRRREVYEASFSAHVATLGDEGNQQATVIQSMARAHLARKGPAGQAVVDLSRTEAERNRIFFGQIWDEARLLSQIPVVKGGGWLIDLDYCTPETELTRCNLNPNPHPQATVKWINPFPLALAVDSNPRGTTWQAFL